MSGDCERGTGTNPKPGNLGGSWRMVLARVYYLENGVERFLKAPLLEETDEYVRLQLDNYNVTISKKIILKLEVSR